MDKIAKTKVKRNESKRSFGLQWHITDKCDQRCKHCYIWGNNTRISCGEKEIDLFKCKKIVDDFLRFCKEFNMEPVINITGGDPLLFLDIWELLGYINKQKIVFRILGNPFHLDDVVCDRLFSLGCRAYQMSLDGLEATHDYIRKKGSFDATLSAIDKLKKNGIRSVIMSTVSKLNYQEIPDLVRIVVEMGVDVYDFARYCPLTKDEDFQFLPLEYKEFLSKMWEIYTELASRKTLFPLKDNLWILWLYESGLFKLKKEDVVFQGCNCGVSHLTLLPNGNIFACRRFESYVGNIFSQSFYDIFLGEKIDQYRDIDKLEGCRDCDLLNYCRGCHAVSYGVYGDFFAKDPQCWKNN